MRKATRHFIPSLLPHILSHLLAMLFLLWLVVVCIDTNNGGAITRFSLMSCQLSQPATCSIAERTIEVNWFYKLAIYIR